VEGECRCTSPPSNLGILARPPKCRSCVPMVPILSVFLVRFGEISASPSVLAYVLLTFVGRHLLRGLLAVLAPAVTPRIAKHACTTTPPTTMALGYRWICLSGANGMHLSVLQYDVSSLRESDYGETCICFCVCRMRYHNREFSIPPLGKAQNRHPSWQMCGVASASTSLSHRWEPYR